MTTTYLELVNENLSRLNQVQLNSGNFASATGFHDQVKRAVNNALRDIYAEEYFWPFLYSEQTQVLTAGTRDYAFGATIDIVDWESFYIAADGGLNVKAKKLKNIEYQEWKNHYLDKDLNLGPTEYGEPDFVYPTPDGNWGISTVPDIAYTVKYNAWLKPVDLAAFDDTMDIPDRFRQVVIDASMMYAYRFRDNEEQAQMAKRDYERGLKTMRQKLINKYHYMRSDRVKGIG
jgi:hypothetical protein